MHLHTAAGAPISTGCLSLPNLPSLDVGMETRAPSKVAPWAPYVRRVVNTVQVKNHEATPTMSSNDFVPTSWPIHHNHLIHHDTSSNS